MQAVSVLQKTVNELSNSKWQNFDRATSAKLLTYSLLLRLMPGCDEFEPDNFLMYLARWFRLGVSFSELNVGVFVACMLLK